MVSFTVNYTSLELEFMALLALMKIAWLKTKVLNTAVQHKLGYPPYKLCYTKAQQTTPTKDHWFVQITDPIVEICY